MLTAVGDLYIWVVDACMAVFGLAAQFFLLRPWMMPLIPILMLVLFIGWRARRAAAPRPAGSLRAPARRSVP